jgi:hypothetical protein
MEFVLPFGRYVGNMSRKVPYLKLMSSAGVKFDMYDEQWFSALTHFVLSYSPNARQAIPIVEGALHKSLRKEVNAST